MEQSSQVRQRYEALAETLEDRLKLHASYRKVFGNEDGERILRHLLKECGILNPRITVDANMLLVKQGQQHIVLSILKILGMDKNVIIEQLKQSLNNED